MIAIFDSGVGGLSVLRHVRQQLPDQALLYFADSAYAPYGDKTTAQICARSLRVVAFLHAQSISALVVACNTATAAAITELRSAFPELPIVGMEPGLKPALAAHPHNKIGVLATTSTLQSEKFRALQTRLEQETGRRFITQACPGLVECIERGELRGTETRTLLHTYLHPLLAQDVRTLVLGCTHYPFVQNLIWELAAEAGVRDLHIVETGAAVARQLQRVLHKKLARTTPGNASVSALTSGQIVQLNSAFRNLLGVHEIRAQFVEIT